MSRVSPPPGSELREGPVPKDGSRVWPNGRVERANGVVKMHSADFSLLVKVRMSKARMSMLFLVALCAVALDASEASERDALQSLYDALGGDQWERNDNWGSDAPLGEWHGIGTHNGHVLEIDLAGNGLTGELPDGLEDLRRLQALDLRWNTIWGAIPESIGELANLESVLLSGNELTGDIPRAFGSMPALQRLDLSYNRLSGEIPATLGQSRTLRALGLQHNQLTGSLPSELSRIGTLQRLIANGNHLTGPVPPELERMPHLKLVDSERLALAVPGASAPVDANARRPGEISGLDLLDETTMIIDEEVAGLMGQVMAAIVVRDGKLHLDAKTLPLPFMEEQLKAAVEGINERLREAGRRIESVNDLDRAFELYDGGPAIELNLPEAPGGSVYRPGASKTVDIVERRNLAAAPRSSARGFRNVVNCAKTKAGYPHKSNTKRSYGKIIGKGQAACRYFGSHQIIGYNAHAYLQRWRGWRLFGFWQRVGASGNKRKKGDSVKFEQRELVAVAPCRSGTYRARLALYVFGSADGPFYPFPGLFASAPRNICC